MKEKLLELLKAFRTPICEGLNAKLPDAECIADYLFANGCVILPCKVGDAVFQIDCQRVYESKVKNVIFDTDGVAFDERAIGTSIYLTREEAEKALAERRI